MPLQSIIYTTHQNERTKMIFAANFKCNLPQKAVADYFSKWNTFRFCQSFLSQNQILFFPSFLGLQTAKELSSFEQIGAQNAYPVKNGAFTSEIGLEALESMGIDMVLIGHSERRVLLKESQEICAMKFDFFAKHHFKIVYCVGESLEVREQGREATQEFLLSQFRGIDTQYQNLIIAYEPIWAIGTGVSAKAKDIECVHSFLSTLSPQPILYGGSVNKDNAKEILAIDHVSGLLVGSASLDPQHFYTITQSIP